MTETNTKVDLQRYLQAGRDVLLWKLGGLSEYDVRRPLTPTGTNLLGLVKHLAYVEMGYFGATFGRPIEAARTWVEDEDPTPNWDMWATPEQSTEQIVTFYRTAWGHADATIAELPLDTAGRVPWWEGERAVVTLHRVLVHVIAETQRHAGHADIVRELIDGAAGLRAGNDNLAPGDRAWWQSYRNQLESAARDAAG